MNSDILIFGGGFIGQKLQKEFNCNLTEKIINNFDDAYSQVEKYNPKIIINCIGITGKNNVDDCESEKSNTLLANTFIPIILGDIALRKNIKLVHISSGCMYHFDYDEQSPITEEDIPDFLGLFYSRSKMYADAALKMLFREANILITRIRIPLDSKPHPKNIINKLLKFEKIIDIENSITYIPDYIKMLRFLIEKDARGIYNTVNKTPLKYSKLLDVYKKYVPGYNYTLVDYKSLPLTRTNLIMSTKKLEDLGFKVRDIEDVLEECIREYVKHR